MGKARGHWARASELKQERLNAGQSYEYAVQGARWHQRRAYGQMTRFERAFDCRQRKFWLLCRECGRVHEREQRCAQPVLCLSCRGAIGRRKRVVFQIARERALSKAVEMGLLNVSYVSRRWTEKLLTLTAPHLDEHDVQQRVVLLWDAWPVFLKALNRLFSRVPSKYRWLISWYRTFEWTPGSDKKGHPHFHIWLLCPFVDRDEIQALWANALRVAGYTAEQTETVIVDLRLVTDGVGAANEVIKYLTKDVMPDRSQVPAAAYARLLETIDGRRVTQCSKGFEKNIQLDAKCECGAVGSFKRLSRPPAIDKPGDGNGQ